MERRVEHRLISGFASAAARVAVTALCGFAAPVVIAQGALGPDCRSFTTPEEISAHADAAPHVCAFNSEVNAAAGTNIRHVLLYDWTSGGLNRGHTQRHMLRLSRQYGFRLDRSQARDYITPATLQDVDVVVFNNGFNDPLQNSTSLQAMRNFVEAQGKGILAIHAALAFIPCPGEDMTNANCRWFLRAFRTQYWRSNNHNPSHAARIYADSVLPGEIPPNAIGVDSIYATIPHGRMNPATRNIFEQLPLNGPSGPFANRPYIWEGSWDEWFNYNNHPRRENIVAGTNYGLPDMPLFGPINILLSLDETSQSDFVSCNAGGNCKTGDRPISWTRRVGYGHVAYNNAGHGDVYVRSRQVGDSTVNDSLMEKYNWRVMKYLARDFVGCMDPESEHYNPEATVEVLTPVFEDPDPCDPIVTSIRPVASGTLRAGVAFRDGAIQVMLPEAGPHRIRVLDLSGREVFATRARGGGASFAIPSPGRGSYVVDVEGPHGRAHARRVVVD